MSLKDKLKQRASQLVKEESVMHDLPPHFSAELEEVCRQERIQCHFVGTHREQFLYIGTTPGHRQAFLSYFPQMGGFLSLRDIELLLDQAGIVHGIDLSALKKHCNGDELVSSFIHVCVAKGTPMVPGKAGYLELHRRPYNSSHQPDLESFDQVQPEDEIGVIYPAEKGEVGMTVLGEEISPPTTTSENFHTNNNIKVISEDGKSTLMSMVKGYVSHYNQEIAVYSDLVLNDDITVNRGNLIYDSNVIVKGNTQENVTLTIGGNLTIEGAVSQSQIQVEGDLLIHKGLFGRSESKVTVGKRLKCRYLNEVEVEVEEDLFVEKEILNSHTWTRSKLKGTRAVIVGGTCFAQAGLELAQIGSDLGLKTIVSVGLDKREYQIEHKLIPECEELKIRLAKAQALFPKASSQNKEALENNILNLRGEIESRESEIEYHKRRLLPADSSATMQIHKAIMPGTTLMIGHVSLNVLEKLDGPLVVSLQNDQISIKRT